VCEPRLLTAILDYLIVFIVFPKRISCNDQVSKTPKQYIKYLNSAEKLYSNILERALSFNNDDVLAMQM